MFGYSCGRSGAGHRGFRTGGIGLGVVLDMSVRARDLEAVAGSIWFWGSAFAAECGAVQSQVFKACETLRLGFLQYIGEARIGLSLAVWGKDVITGWNFCLESKEQGFSTSNSAWVFFVLAPSLLHPC